jgi:hypothetical protein
MICTAQAARSRDERAPLADPGLDSVAIRSDIAGRLNRICAEQLARPAKQCAHFVQLLLEPGIIHMLKLLRPGYSHNSPLRANTEAGQTLKLFLPLMTVGLAGGDLRSEYGAAAPPESYPRIPQDSGLQRSGRLHAVGDGWAVACRAVSSYR